MLASNCCHWGSVSLGFVLPASVIFVVSLLFLARDPILKPPSPVEILPPAVLTPTQFPQPSLTSTPPPTPTPTSVPTPAASPTPKPVSGPPGTGVSTLTVATEKGNFRAIVMSLDGVRMLTDTASDSECGNDCPVLSLEEYVTRNGGFAGVNGTYFCPSDYPDCASKKNSFDFPVFNSRLRKWMSQDSLSWGGRSILYYDGGGYRYNQNSQNYPGSPHAAIINYPGLVNEGQIQIDENQSGLSDKQKAKGTKVILATRHPSNVMVILTYGTTMREAAYVAKSLGATGALNLDDGGSTAIYYSGRYLAGPGRKLPNAVIFTR